MNKWFWNNYTFQLIRIEFMGTPNQMSYIEPHIPHWPLSLATAHGVRIGPVGDPVDAEMIALPDAWVPDSIKEAAGV